ncbi:MAG: chemotaxis response regulator protein-glutamate methylesterase [Verrucomicrobia bacterium]|nr:chemotaxis response regulator protein-glutamate methylesterase [Verrucomicrobiota bacterium]
MCARPIRVLVVDDSAVVRKLVTDALKTDPDIEVVGTAIDPYAARDKIQQLQPDVLTLDLEMPRMDGLTFLKIIMEQRPLPVIIMSSLTQRGSDYALEALRLGAVDVLAKPGGPYSFGDLGPQLIARIKACAGARIRGPRADSPVRKAAAHVPPPAAAPPGRVAAPDFSRPAPLVRASSPATRHPRGLILLGASTGGTEALREVLTRLPDGLPPIAVVQHIPPVFSKNFADRLNQLCAFEVREAVDGDKLLPGLALIAPGNFHLLLQWSGDGYRARVVGGPPVWHQRPAVDLLFKSAADCGAAPHATAGVFTGMGRDGADGLLRLRQLGARTFAQDEATSVVYGMPRAAWENGAAQHQVPLERAAEYIVRHIETPNAAPVPAAAHA